MSQTRDQEHFTISEAADDRRELMIQSNTLRSTCSHPLPALMNSRTHGLQPADIPQPQSATDSEFHCYTATAPLTAMTTNTTISVISIAAAAAAAAAATATATATTTAVTAVAS